VLDLTRPRADAGTGESLKSHRQAWFAGAGRVATPVHDRARIAPGIPVAGPAIIESLDSTIVIPPSWQATPDDGGFVTMTRSDAGDPR